MMNSIYNITNNFKLLSEEDITDLLFGDPRLNKVVYYPDTDFPSSMETYICYALSMFKTLLIRNTIFQKNSLITPYFYLFVQNKYMFKYPIDFLDKNTYPYQNYYNTGNIPLLTGCNNAFGGNDCFETFQNFTNGKDPNSKYVPESDIYFDQPMIQSGQLFSRGCIKIQGGDIAALPDSNYACMDININNVLKNVAINPFSTYGNSNTNVVKLFLVNADPSGDFNLFYSNTVDMNSMNSLIYDDNDLKAWRLTKTNKNYKLFHGIHFPIFNSTSDLKGGIVETVTKGIIVDEYKDLVKKLNNIMGKFTANATACDSYSSYENLSNLTTTQHFINKPNTFNSKNSTQSKKYKIISFSHWFGHCICRN